MACQVHWIINEVLSPSCGGVTDLCGGGWRGLLLGGREYFLEGEQPFGDEGIQEFAVGGGDGFHMALVQRHRGHASNRKREIGAGNLVHSSGEVNCQ